MNSLRTPVSRLAVAGFALAMLPGLLFVADLYSDVASRMLASHARTAALGWSLLAITAAGGIASIAGLLHVRRHSSLAGMHLARIGIVLSLLNLWLVPHLARLLIREPVDLDRNNCLRIMRQIDLAKEEWAIENGATYGGPVTMEDILPHLQPEEAPRCPAGGEYFIGAIESSPRCSIHGELWASEPTPGNR